MNFERWPFDPVTMRLPEQEARWWAECYQPDPATALFAADAGSAALIGGPGSGKSTALAAMTRHVSSDLVIRYEPRYWPSGKRPWVAGGGHVSQIMAAAALEIVSCLEQNPKRYGKLDDLNVSFARWLIATHLHQRTLRRMLSRIAQATGEPLDLSADVEPLFSNASDTELWNQISELAELSQALGYGRILILTDLDEIQASIARRDLEALLSSLDLMRYKGYALRLTLPASDDLVKVAQELSRGQLQFLRLDESPAFVQQVVTSHLRVATDDACQTLADLADESVLERANAETERLYGRPHALAGQLQWARTLLYLNRKSGRVTDPQDAILAYYKQHVHLQLTEGRQGVWRGPQYIPLDKGLYDMLHELFLLGGVPAPDALIARAFTSTNLNTQMSRLRARIEPPGDDGDDSPDTTEDEASAEEPGDARPKRKRGRPSNRPMVYIHNRRDLGYWLENFVPLTSYEKGRS